MDGVNAREERKNYNFNGGKGRSVLGVLRKRISLVLEVLNKYSHKKV
ncbi:MAG: hypothetical protein O1I36_15435 [Cylindrospermopsis raciborskii PAMP2011]|nr:hypothetical protein [Cylindrospermopsis raciborskii PAMP2011]